MPTTSERQSKGDLHWDLPEDRVESIRLERPGSVVELVRDGDAWRLTQPAPYPADSFAASDLARQLAQLKRVGGDSSEAKAEDYGLATPSGKATIVWKDAGDAQKKSTRTVEFGMDIPGTDIAAARVAGQTRVLFVPASVSAAVKKGAADFLSKDVFGGTGGRRRADRSRARARAPDARAARRHLVDGAAAQGPGRRGRRLSPGRRPDVAAGDGISDSGQGQPLVLGPVSSALSGDALGCEGQGDDGRIRFDAVGRQLALRAAGEPGLHGGNDHRRGVLQGSGSLPGHPPGEVRPREGLGTRRDVRRRAHRDFPRQGRGLGRFGKTRPCRLGRRPDDGRAGPQEPRLRRPGGGPEPRGAGTFRLRPGRIGGGRALGDQGLCGRGRSVRHGFRTTRGVPAEREPGRRPSRRLPEGRRRPRPTAAPTRKP